MIINTDINKNNWTTTEPNNHGKNQGTFIRRYSRKYTYIRSGSKRNRKTKQPLRELQFMNTPMQCLWTTGPAMTWQCSPFDFQLIIVLKDGERFMQD
uniref:Uncharacterized protein n=1 Tax=Globodera rostochiensis TaxID=31243 RepID=A0A914HHH7_GLORO